MLPHNAAFSVISAHRAQGFLTVLVMVPGFGFAD